MALYWQYARGGRTGRIIDVWLLESCFALLESVAPEYAATGSVRQPSGTELSGLAPSNLFRAADNRWVVIAANQDAIFGRLCAAMDSPDLAREPRFSSHTARSEHQQEIENIVSRRAEPYSSEELARRLDDAGVPSVVVFTVADIFTERDMLLTHNCGDGHPLVMPGIVPKLSGTPGDARWAGGGVGSHHREVFGDLLGPTDDELAGLEKAGVL